MGILVTIRMDNNEDGMSENAIWADLFGTLNLKEVYLSNLTRDISILTAELYGEGADFISNIYITGRNWLRNSIRVRFSVP